MINSLRDQAGQVQHRGSAHAGADVGRARGQITELRIVGEIEFALERAVDFIDQLERALQLQTGADRLHAQMIFFVDHDAERLPAIHDNGAADTFGRMLATNEMTFDQDLFFGRGKILQHL